MQGKEGGGSSDFAAFFSAGQDPWQRSGEEKMKKWNVFFVFLSLHVRAQIMCVCERAQALT